MMRKFNIDTETDQFMTHLFDCVLPETPFLTPRHMTVLFVCRARARTTL
jgi:hypothetical protein